MITRIGADASGRMGTKATKKPRFCGAFGSSADGCEWVSGGEGGIRTPGTVAGTPHFECGAIDGVTLRFEFEGAATGAFAQAATASQVGGTGVGGLVVRNDVRSDVTAYIDGQTMTLKKKY